MATQLPDAERLLTAPLPDSKKNDNTQVHSTQCHIDTKGWRAAACWPLKASRENLGGNMFPLLGQLSKAIQIKCQMLRTTDWKAANIFVEIDFHVESSLNRACDEGSNGIANGP